MKKLFYLFFLTSFLVMSQNPKPEDIVGTYKLPNSNPEGGQSIVIFENNTFATFYFGGALKGTWKVAGNEVKFKTTSNPKFYLFGRKLTTLKDSTHLNFSCERYGTYVNLNAKTNDTLQPLFNKNANCFDYPYINKTNSQLNTLIFATKSTKKREGNYSIYTFNVNEKYNDLIVIGLPKQYTSETEFSATYKDGKLYFGSGKPASKKPDSIKESEENLAFMDKFMNEELVPEILVYGNEFFPNYDNPTEEQLTPYTKIAPTIKEKGNIIVGEKNLFTAICEDE